MLLRTLASAGFLLAATAAQADLQVYEVDAQTAGEVVGALNEAVQNQCRTRNAVCSVKLLPSGQLLVEAPTDTHGQVAAVLKAVAAHRAGPAARVTVRYWVVVGTPRTASAPDAKRAPPAALQPVLKQLERVHGDMQFKVAGEAAVTGNDGSPATTTGGPLAVSQSGRVVGDSLTATVSLGLKDAEQQLHVGVTIKRGEYVVLGEQSTPDGEGITFYIVNWPE